MSSNTTRKRSKYQSSKSDSDNSAHSFPSVTSETAVVHDGDGDKNIVTVSSLLACISAVVTDLHAHVELGMHCTEVHKSEPGIFHVPEAQRQRSSYPLQHHPQDKPAAYGDNAFHLIEQQNHENVRDISTLPKDVLHEKLQPVVRQLEQIQVDTILPDLEPVRPPKNKGKQNGDDNGGVSLGDG